MREREASAAASAVAAAKIAELEEEVLSLQNAFADQQSSDKAAKDEMRRNMQAQKERGEHAEHFKISSDGEQEEEEVLEGQPAFEDLPPLKDWEDEFAGLSAQGTVSQSSTSGAQGDLKQTFFPSSKPKMKPAMSSAKTTPIVKGDQALSFRSG